MADLLRLGATRAIGRTLGVFFLMPPLLILGVLPPLLPAGVLLRGLAVVVLGVLLLAAAGALPFFFFFAAASLPAAPDFCEVDKVERRVGRWLEARFWNCFCEFERDVDQTYLLLLGCLVSTLLLRTGMLFLLLRDELIQAQT